MKIIMLFSVATQTVNRSRRRSWLKRVDSFTHMPSGSHETQLLASVHRLEAAWGVSELEVSIYPHTFGFPPYVLTPDMFVFPPYVVIKFCDPFFFHNHAHIHIHRPLSSVPPWTDPLGLLTPSQTT